MRLGGRRRAGCLGTGLMTDFRDGERVGGLWEAMISMCGAGFGLCGMVGYGIVCGSDLWCLQARIYG